MVNKLPLNVWLLTVTQALMMSVGSLVVLVGGLVGAKIAPLENLATLPVASLIVGTASTVVPVTLLMKKIGRRTSFLIISLFSIGVALLAAYAVYISAFYLFCASIFLLGITNSCIMQFRFAAIESVPYDLIAKAAATVLLGGIAAAFIGPEMALLGKDILDVDFSGSFVLLAGLFLLGFFILLAFKNPIIESKNIESAQRPLSEISRQSVFWVAILSATVGYAVMSFIMTATPVSMHVMDSHSLSDTKWVIQSHVLAMYLPSIIAAWIIRRLGITRMLIIGLFAFTICIAIAYSGHHLGNYWVSLILLGVGWNFLFIGGTTLLPQSYQPGERFKVQAINEFFVFGTQALASLSAGWFVFAVGWETMLTFTLPIIFFHAIIIGRWTMQKRKLVKVKT